MLPSWLGLRSMGSPPASLRPPPPLCDYERGFAPQREQRPESDRPSADTETCMLVGLRRSLASSRANQVNLKAGLESAHGSRVSVRS